MFSEVLNTDGFSVGLPSAWKFLHRRKQSQLMTEIRTISKQKGKRLLNKLVYSQSLSNRALDFKIKAKKL